MQRIPMRRAENADPRVVAGFGEEWSRFDQSQLTEAELDDMARAYFSVFPWDTLPDRAVGLDLGCGSGRWARYVAPRVDHLHCLDASPAAVRVARRNLAGLANVSLHVASVDAIPLPDRCLDFAYALGVLHHVPRTSEGMASVVRKLKPGAPLLLYLYYAFDNRPAWYRWLWRATEPARYAISRAPVKVRAALSDVAAAAVYWPVARTLRLAEVCGIPVENFPLAAYRRRSFYVMRTDALDRFGTRLERRFTRDQIAQMMQAAGLRGILFSEDPPYWCVVGRREHDA
jgi:SAM-dependent methyltransferase